jgi:hypothetical protein
VDGDPESAAFAKHLADMFSAAGWNPLLGSILPVGSTPMGLALRVPSKAPVRSNSPLYHAAALEQALEKIGFPCNTNELPSLPADKADLLVGHKP